MVKWLFNFISLRYDDERRRKTMGDDELADDNTDAAVLNELDAGSSQSSDVPLTDNPDSGSRA